MREHHMSKKDLAVETVALRKQVQDLKDAAAARRRVEEALRNSEALYREMVEEAGIGLVRLGPGGEVQGINPAFLQRLGYGSLQEFRLAPGYPHLFAEAGAYARVLAGAGEAVEAVTARLRHRDGSARTFVLLTRGPAGPEAGMTLVLVTGIPQRVEAPSGSTAGQDGSDSGR